MTRSADRFCRAVHGRRLCAVDVCVAVVPVAFRRRCRPLPFTVVLLVRLVGLAAVPVVGLVIPIRFAPE
ncbi:hypothetical protein ACFFQF_13680 [Haladaptatus pallidirubidus]|uniref:hypothetical protein n=1 Tax=Haladaptatus pallidirubidus TaxID=1008152 RepID=UPI001D11C99D|nr:hypothetical protein [Haladaptatus pallidirubidus]